MANYFSSQEELSQIQDIVDQITLGLTVLEYKNQNLSLSSKRLPANQFNLAKNNFEDLWKKELHLPIPKRIFYKIK
ncbi:MAG: hypothetical protein NTX26_01645 [Candidatus Parcubacteria bacterium]|nr:hypothetical protein [Candidatus Parcubacteria bacterium]